MTVVIACMVCARPFDALLTSGLHAGVAVMAAVAVGVMAMLARGVIRLLREDRDALAGADQHVGASSEAVPDIELTNASGGTGIGG
jgi:hypothetical protein